MSKVLDLTKIGKLEANTNKKKGLVAASNPLPPEADFLQVLSAPTVNMVCCFKDNGDITGSFERTRLSMFTIPQGVNYQNYRIDWLLPNDPIFILRDKGEPLSSGVHTLLVYDVNYPPQTAFHFCDDNPSQTDTPDPKYACVDTLTSRRASRDKPFQVFYADNLTLYSSFNAKNPIPGPYYLVPFAISEGVTVYYIVHGTETKKKIKLQAFLTEISKTQRDNDPNKPVSHWRIKSEIIYHDKYGIFTCTKIESVNKVTIE